MNNRRKYILHKPLIRKSLRERKRRYTDKAKRDLQFFFDMIDNLN